MKDEELGSTKPIKTIDPKTVSREEKFEDILDDFDFEELETREEKYNKKVEEEKDKEAEEEAEKALAQKNIALAHEYLEEEKKLKKEKIAKEKEEEKEELKDEEPEGKKKGKFKAWWGSLDKGQKLIYGLIFVLFLLLFILFVIGVIALTHKKEEKTNNETPEEVIEQEEQAPVMFDNYYYKGGTLYFLSEGQSEIGSYECNNKSEILCTVAVNNYRDILDVAMVASEDGQSLTEYVSIVDENYVFINDTAIEGGKNVVLYSIKNNETIDTYGDVKAYDGGYYVVSDNSGKYGLIQIKNDVKVLIKPQYEYLGMIDNENYLVAKEKKGYIIIDKADRGISKHVDAPEIKFYNSNFLVTKANGTYSVYNLKGEELQSGYSFATVKGKYMFLINDKQLFVRDNEGNKLNENGIPLTNGDYVRTFIFDDKMQLLNTKRSFDVEIKKDNINIGVYSSNYDNPQYTSLSLAEATVNKNYEFVNYFDGNLFFYRDKEKEDLIGFYTCTNKNDVKASDKTYKDCFVAKDTVYEDNDYTTDAIKNRKTLIPLINNKYVFIKDENVILFDLETRAVKSSYLSVNTYSENNNFKFTTREGKVNIVALNKKGKYGVIRIDGSSVGTLYKFNYNKIEMLNEELIGQDTEEKWVLFVEGRLEGFAPGKIQSYNSDYSYVTATKNNLYYVYNTDGEAINKDGGYYASVYDDFYVLVNNDLELSIYDYTGTQIAEGSVKIEKYKVVGTTAPAYKIKKHADHFTVSVYNGNTYVDHDLNIIKNEHQQ